MQTWLQSWIMNYVDGDPANSSETTKAKKPLAAAEVGKEARLLAAQPHGALLPRIRQDLGDVLAHGLEDAEMRGVLDRDEVQKAGTCLLMCWNSFKLKHCFTSPIKFR